ncbi:hypothetical protein DSO57_1005018 [Entomophthora muscae]|uniref:Uncharacterized protein n=1 Tax=Entomophthora muscae TaxID=34485 RepID=A0ACC2TJX9_9FUNG|nr:hypothetical protein DSO57_1005018 [Entomophthora muscae]
MIAAYYTYHFCTRCTIAHNKPRPESHPSTEQALTSFPDLPKVDLASFKKGMVMINALFRAHPENYRDNA